MTEFEQQHPKPDWNVISEKSTDLKNMWNMWDRFKVCDGNLYVKWISSVGQEQTRLVVPEPFRGVVLKCHHDIATAAHLGVEKTLEKVKHNFYWPGMRQYVKEYTRTCNKCAARKANVSKKNMTPLGTYNVGAAIQRVAIDILVSLPKTDKGYKYCLVLTDCFNKWTEAFAIPDQEALTIAKTLVNKLVCRFGTPLQFDSDQGTNLDLVCFRKCVTCYVLTKKKNNKFSSPIQWMC